MPSAEHLERCKFYETALDLLDRELGSEDVSPDQLQKYIESLQPSLNYPLHMLLEDFVESSSLATLEHIHSLLDSHPLTMENPESTKMGVLKIFNLFSRRQFEGFGTENMARFMLLVASAVKISDRSGVNLKGEKNGKHARYIGGEQEASPLIRAIANLQDVMYSPSAIPSAVNMALNEIFALIAPSLYDNDEKTLNQEMEQLQPAPYLLLDTASRTIDVHSAIIVLLQCYILADCLEDKEAKSGHIRQVTSLLKKTAIGRKVTKLLPLVSNSDLKWRKWKREQQCRDVSQPAYPIVIEPEYHKLTNRPAEILPDEAAENVHSGPLSEDAIVESQWAASRRKAFE